LSSKLPLKTKGGGEDGRQIEGNIRITPTEGQRTMPTGPSPRVKGSFFSSSNANMIKGRQNANVLPEPVKAIPIMSRPEKLFKRVNNANEQGKLSYATGMPWI
jgi:hypothetical protein